MANQIIAMVMLDNEMQPQEKNRKDSSFHVILSYAPFSIGLQVVEALKAYRKSYISNLFSQLPTTVPIRWLAIVKYHFTFAESHLN